MNLFKRSFATGLACCIATVGCSSSSSDPDAAPAVDTDELAILVDTNDQPVRFEFDGPTYESAIALFEGADLVVEGVRGDVVARLADFGRPGDDTSEFGIPWEFYEVEITRVIAGKHDDKVTLVSMLDPVLAVSEATVATAHGETLVLFLRKETAQTAPGLARIGSDYYFPLNGSNGVFRVVEGDAVATSPIVTGVDTAPEGQFHADHDGEDVGRDTAELLRISLSRLEELARSTTG